MQNISLTQFIVLSFLSIVIFIALSCIGKFTVNKLEAMSSLKNSRFLNPSEYFPSEKILTLRQVFHLIMILVFIIIILYLIFDWKDGSYFICTLDILISIYLSINMSKDTFKGKLLYFLLIPFGSITRLIFGESLMVLLDIFHIFAYLYFIKVYYRKFMKYTENNSLGITIILLYCIILVSFLFTILVEGVSPMDSITMVTNAFTSNSFEVSGKTMIGKLDSLLLAWGGYILSGVGTATLAVSIIMRHINKKFDHLEDLIKKNKKY